MTWAEEVLVVAAVVLLLGWAFWVEASRLDRLHRKVAASRTVLDVQLVRRATVAAELGASGVMDPVSSLVVAEAAFASLEASGRTAPADAAVLADLPPTPAVDRGLVESELSATLRTALGDAAEVTLLREEPSAAELLDELAAAWYRVQLARRFHNEAVVQTQRVRAKPLARALRLAGRAPRPQTVELDDAWPEGLGRPGASTASAAV
ncbi:hypothetical protein [Cellulomonas fimi]|uniref:NUDIX hydrolase n=1 Tax=Cellulomonas fimi TaxID=1708 RepID=A0A7Y0LY97_CELFI|nr:hypothetical protein [Cellulomonas fimi]NMR20121.1 hypothetical protein [Cellulomonas fimi]